MLRRQLERSLVGPPLQFLPLLTPRRQPERGRLRPPPLLPPSGQGKLLLRLLAPGARRTSTSPRSAPTRKKKKSKILLLYLWFINPCCLVLYLICFTLNLFLFRTLAQRAAKRAKVPVIVIEDEPTATAGGAPGTTLPDPATFLQSSPQRKYMICYPL